MSELPADPVTGAGGRGRAARRPARGASPRRPASTPTGFPAREGSSALDVAVSALGRARPRARSSSRSSLDSSRRPGRPGARGRPSELDGGRGWRPSSRLATRSTATGRTRVGVATFRTRRADALELRVDGVLAEAYRGLFRRRSRAGAAGGCWHGRGRQREPPLAAVSRVGIASGSWRPGRDELDVLRGASTMSAPDPPDHALVEAVARRVVELLREEGLVAAPARRYLTDGGGRPAPRRDGGLGPPQPRALGAVRSAAPAGRSASRRRRSRPTSALSGRRGVRTGRIRLRERSRAAAAEAG